MKLGNERKMIIVLEEQNENRGLTHVVSDEAFRYPKPYDGDLYVVGFDVKQNIHFLLVETPNPDEVIIRVIEDEELFDKLLRYYQDPERLPSSEVDEKIRLSVGTPLDENTQSEQMRQRMTKLPVDF